MGGDFDAIVDAILAAGSPGSRVLVGIDGIGGAGKSTFAAAVARRVAGQPVVVIHADDFFNPTEVRHRHGRHSPEGFWFDAYNLTALVEWVLRPLRSDGTGWYRSGCYNRSTGELAAPDRLDAPADALVLVEGTFLHRAELAPWWDFSIYLDIPFSEAATRMARRDQLSEQNAAALIRRYQDAQRLYFAAARPWLHANLVIDHTDPEAPRIIEPEGSEASRSRSGCL